MQYITIPEASKIYEFGYVSVTQIHNVLHEKFAEFSHDLRDLEHGLGQENKDNFWVPIFRLLRRYRYYVSSAPLPFDFRGEEKNREIMKWLKDQVSLCPNIFPDQASQLAKVISNLEALYRLHENPLLNSIDNIISKFEKKASVLIKEATLIPYVASAIQEKRSLSILDVVTSSQLRGLALSQPLIMVGASQWFYQDEYIFTAPRVSNIHIVKYSWLDCHWKQSIELYGAVNNPKREAAKEQFEATTSEIKELTSYWINPSELIPYIDWDHVKKNLEVKQDMVHNPNAEETEYVDAKLFLLEGGAAVALDCDPSSKTTVVDPEQREGSPLKRMLVSDLKPGMFILVRTQGSREYVAIVADAIMGSKAMTARNEQKHWKLLLKNSVQKSTISAVVYELRGLGSIIANEINVRNWMSYRTIKPQNRSDFDAIMRLIGIEQNAESYWLTMCMIDSAHLRAGQRIARLLLSEVRKSDISLLLRTGRMDFTLAAVGAGKLSAIRVQGINAELVSVPVYRLDRLLEEGDIYG